MTGGRAFPATLRATAVLLLLLASGCASTPEAATPSVHIDWSQTVAITTTASEPFEYRGFIRATWARDVFAVDTEQESDMPRFAQRDGQRYFTTQTGMGWTEQGPEAIDTRALSNRLVLWDLRLVLDDPGMQVEVVATRSGYEIVAEGVLQGLTEQPEVRLHLVVVDGIIINGTLSSPAGRESPFYFAPSTAPVGFEPGAHAPSLPRQEVQEGNRDAREGHAVLIQAIQDHQARRGSLPDDVDPDSLAAEMLLDGREWPQNPFAGGPMQDAMASGDYRWIRCGEGRGHYWGMGWDSPVLTKAFGGGCPKQPG